MDNTTIFYISLLCMPMVRGKAMIYHITPVSKPRQTRSDKWKKRPCVMKYRAFADECREQGIIIPNHGAHIVFQMPMPKSWSKKKKEEMDGMPHQQRPDVDNLAKALMDAVLKEDCCVWDVRITKEWGYCASIEINIPLYELQPS